MKKLIFEVIKSACNNIEDRSRWLGAEIAELGLKYNGLDDIPLDSVLILSALFASGTLDDIKLIKLTEIDTQKINEYFDVLIEYSLMKESPDSGEYELTEKGVNLCQEIFKKVITRKRFELKRALDHIELIYSNISKI